MKRLLGLALVLLAVAVAVATQSPIPFIVVPIGMSVQIPRGVVRLPWTLTERTSGLVASDTTANVESEHFRWQVPRKQSISVRKGDRIYLYIATSVPAQITTGTFRLYIADATRITRRHLVLEAAVAELDAGGTREDTTMQYKFAMGFSLKEDDYLIGTVESPSVADDAQLVLTITGVQFIQT